MVLRSNSLLFLCATLLLAGCGGSGRDVSEEALDQMAGGSREETVAVSGTVFINGTPAANVNIYAYTEESGMEPASKCRTEADGTYCWWKYVMCDGLVPGEYRLAFAHVPKEPKNDQKEGKDLLQGKYRNPIENDFPLLVESGKPQVDVNYELEQ